MVSRSTAVTGPMTSLTTVIASVTRPVESGRAATRTTWPTLKSRALRRCPSMVTGTFGP